jgi:hypothetical protein
MMVTGKVQMPASSKKKETTQKEKEKRTQTRVTMMVVVGSHCLHSGCWSWSWRLHRLESTAQACWLPRWFRAWR